MKQAKHSLLRELQRAISTPDSEGISRRNFLRSGLKASMVLGVSQMIPDYFFTSNKNPRIVILGAGIAGLTAAHYLSKAGLHADIFEANNFIGGRMQTATNVLGANLTSEIGGEFIDTNHYEIRRLVDEFGLSLKDHSTDVLSKPKTKETYFVGGRRYTLAEVIRSFNGYAPRIQIDQRKLGSGYDTLHAIQMDKLSIDDYFDKIGMRGWLRSLLDAAYKAEFGATCAEQSALNFLSMISVDTRFDFNVFGESDERFGIVTGNGSLPRKIAEKYTNQISTDHIVSRISQNTSGYLISFSNGKTVSADVIICTIPFSVLRGIDVNVKNYTTEKSKIVNALGYGNNAKLIMGFDERTWRTNHGAAGYLINETIHNGWDSSNMQNENMGAGTYTVYTSAEDAIILAKQKTNAQAAVDNYMPVLDNIFTGSKAAFNQKQIIADWPEVPTIKGAYSFYKPGQWTDIAGKEMEPVGNMFFAGEHCSTDFQGYMNGGAQTGKDVAEMIVKKYANKKR